MHLIRNKSTGDFHQSPNAKLKRPPLNSSSKNIQSKRITNPQTQRVNNFETSKTQKKQKQSGVIERALSSAKAKIEKIIFPIKQTNQKVHVIGDKYTYNQDDMIGKGYSSEVFKGSQIGNRQGKNLAIKILDLKKIKGFLLDLLKKQIQIHKTLNHPNIVKCQDVIQTPTHIYIIQQYCSGGDLGSFINIRKGKITQGQGLNIMSQISEGYKYLIERKILHRDLKPCNIFRCKMTEKWKIGDFGFACKTDEEPDDINVGTPIYMPPQALEKTQYSHQSDFFSLGVIMYEIIYGKVPWFSKSESLLIKKMKEIKIDFEAEKQKINSPVIKKFIQKCCQVDIINRITQQQFMSFQLYPKMPVDNQLSKNKSLSKIKSSQSKISVQQSRQVSVSKNTQKSIQNSIQVYSSYSNKKPRINTNQNVKPIKENSVNKISKASQISTQMNTRVNYHQIQTSNLNECFMANSKILYKQNCFCKHLYFMIKNIDHFLLDLQNKELLVMVMYRHILYILRKLKNNKFNFFQLKKWQLYKQSNQYASFHKEVTINLQRMQNQYFKHPKRKDIKLLRQVDSKFKELDHEVEFNLKFYIKITNYLKQLIRNFHNQMLKSQNTQIQQNSLLLLSKQPSPKLHNFLMTSNSTQNKSIDQSQKVSSPKPNSKISNPSSAKNYQYNSSSPQKVPERQIKTQVSTGQKVKAKAIKTKISQYSSQNVTFYNNSLPSSELKTSPSQRKTSQNFDQFLQLKSKENLNQALFDNIKEVQLHQKQNDTLKSFQKEAQNFIESEYKTKKEETRSQSNYEDIILTDEKVKNLEINQINSQQSFKYQNVSHATLQSMLSLMQYYFWMQQKVTSSKDSHTSFSLIDLQSNLGEQNILSLIRQYSQVKFKAEDIQKIKKLIQSF